MKKYIIPLLNWRVLVLAALALVAFVLVVGEAEDITVLLLTKATGFAMGYACFRLGSHWDKAGLIDELNVYGENV